LILVDAGPLVALLDADDEFHAICLETFRTFKEPLGTVWPPLTEALYLLSGVSGTQEALLGMLARGALQLLPLDSGDIPRMIELMRKYADRPMDFADAALVRVAEREGFETFFTLDRRDFTVYRLHGRIRPTLIP